jgi:hypothetical protein
MNNFIQGQDPYKTMEIGVNRPIKPGDKFECLYYLYYRNGHWCRCPNDLPKLQQFKKKEIYTIDICDHENWHLNSHSTQLGVTIAPYGTFVSYGVLKQCFKRIS